MSYQPIENYGIIGDVHSVALVGMNGSIDWLCFPHFDSPSVFAAILDDEKGGYFKIAPASEARGVTWKQMYWPDTNVLTTRFFSPDGVGEITDYMPVRGAGKDHERQQLIRHVKVVRGDRRSELSGEEVREGWALVLNLPLSLYAPEDLMSQAVELTFETGVIVYDALFVALAEDGDTLVVTADGKLLKALEARPYARLAHALADAGSLIPSIG